MMALDGSTTTFTAALRTASRFKFIRGKRPRRDCLFFFFFCFSWDWHLHLHKAMVYFIPRSGTTVVVWWHRTYTIHSSGGGAGALFVTEPSM
jgi:hypothetical protein